MSVGVIDAVPSGWFTVKGSSPTFAVSIQPRVTHGEVEESKNTNGNIHPPQNEKASNKQRWRVATASAGEKERSQSGRRF